MKNSLILPIRCLVVAMLLGFFKPGAAHAEPGVYKAVEWGEGYPAGIMLPPEATQVVQVAQGSHFTVALTKNGTVLAWGTDEHGEVSTPTGLDAVIAIAAGADHALALKNDGSVVGWGSNASGASTVPPGLSGVKAVAAGFYASIALKNDGSVVAWGANANVPAGLTGIVAVAAGEGFDMALKSDGTVVTWGSGDPLAVPDGLNEVSAIAAGDHHALALKNDGTVVGWGTGSGRVPVGLKEVTAIAAGFYHALALKSDGTVVAWPASNLVDPGVLNVPYGLQSVSFIAAGRSRSAAVGQPSPYYISSLGALTATDITETSATLNAVVYPYFNSTSVRFRFGIDVYLTLPIDQTITRVDGNLPVIVTRTVTGLRPGTKYYFAVVKTEGLAWKGGHSSFTTKRNAIAVTDSVEIRSKPLRFDPRKNDLDPDAVGLEIQEFTQGAHGKVEFGVSVVTSSHLQVPDGTLIYTPNLASPGNDSFSYTLRGGSRTTVTVKSLSSTAPDIVFNNGQPLTFDPLENDKPPAFGNAVIVDISQGAHGKVLLSNGLITYLPASGIAHEDQFTYTLNDQSIGLVTVLMAPVSYQAGLSNSQQVPGESTDTFFGNFGPPTLGPFSGTFRTGTLPPVKAIFAGDGAVLLKAGGAAPGIEGTRISKLGPPNGQAALVTLELQRPAVTTANSTVLYTGLANGNPKASVRIGGNVPGLEGVFFRSIIAFDGNGSTVFFLSTLQGKKVSRSNDLALFALLQDGSLRMLVRKGWGINNSTVTVLSTLVGAQGSLAEGRWRIDDHTIGVRLSFADKSQGIYSIPDDVVKLTEWKTWAVTGQPHAVLPSSFLKLSGFGLPAFGPGGVSYTARIAPYSSQVSRADNLILLHTPAAGPSTILARKADLLTSGNGAAGVAMFFDPVEGANEEVAFLGAFAGKGGKGDTGLFLGSGELIARTGQAAPGGGRWDRFISLVLPNHRGIDALFTAILTGNSTENITPANNLGLWVCLDGKAPSLLLRTGQQFVVRNKTKTIRQFVALAPTAGSIGAASGYDDEGRIHLLVTFDDNTESFIEIALLPEPAAVSAVFASPGMPALTAS
ncbi:MAG: hypothetical protein JWL90_342 [Chthoniobacteraceae bacterium]|nr:hypothetical protein [Chthoniobacteraceae bacterium]